MATAPAEPTAFQIIWRLWEPAGQAHLFWPITNILVDQTKNNDFKPFGAAMTKIEAAGQPDVRNLPERCIRPVTGNEEEHLQSSSPPEFLA